MNERAAKQTILPPELEAMFDKLSDPVSIPKNKLRNILQDLLEQGEQMSLSNVLALRDVSGEAAPTIIEPIPGTKMSDGTIYAGVSPATNKPMYTTPADAPLTMTFNEAKEYAAKLDAHGHDGWRLPTTAELNVLFNNRAAVGGFNESGSDLTGRYCSSSPYGDQGAAWVQRFSDGFQGVNDKTCNSSVRLVR